jgi:hypothetical protein
VDDYLFHLAIDQPISGKNSQIKIPIRATKIKNRIMAVMTQITIILGCAIFNVTPPEQFVF